jgi:hypothetical protein
MTRKDYQVIAAAIKDVTVFSNPSLGTVVNFLVERLALDNPRFDRAKFIKACGLPHYEKI